MTSGSLSYKTEGSAPNRVFTAQYSNVEWNYLATGAVISFQVKLYEASGVVEFVYNQEAGTVNSGLASIGIAAMATGSGNYLSLDGTGTSPTASSTSEATNISTKPASGQIYTFTPPATTPNAPSDLTFSNIGIIGMRLNWTDNASDETGFGIMMSTDGINYSAFGTAAANATSFTASGLSQGTLYYWRIVALNEGRASSAVSGSQSTNASPTMSGTKYVGTGANPQDYANLTDALNDITSQGMSGAVVLELQSGYSGSEPSFPLTITNILGSALRTL